MPCHSGAYGALWCIITHDTVAVHGVLIDLCIVVEALALSVPNTTGKLSTLSCLAFDSQTVGIKGEGQKKQTLVMYCNSE